MGWPWASSLTTQASDQDKSASQAPPTPTKQPKPDYGDTEIAKFMSQIQTEFGSKPIKSSQPPPTAPPFVSAPSKLAPEQPQSAPDSSGSWTSLWGSAAQSSATPTDPSSLSMVSPVAANSSHGEPVLHPISESTLPTEMSCRQAFDTAFYCSSLGSQFHSIYRKGGVKVCSEQWEDFWFCMRTRMFKGKMKEDAIRDYYRKKEWSKYGLGKPSSEDVWESREEKVPVDSAFREEYQDPTISDEDWRMLEIDRRRMIQAALGRSQSAPK